VHRRRLNNSYRRTTSTGWGQRGNRTAWCSPIQKVGGTPRNITEQRTIPRNIKIPLSVGLGISAIAYGCARSQGLLAIGYTITKGVYEQKPSTVIVLIAAAGRAICLLAPLGKIGRDPALLPAPPALASHRIASRFEATLSVQKRDVTEWRQSRTRQITKPSPVQPGWRREGRREPDCPGYSQLCSLGYALEDDAG
jgi:hypothetical protein